METNNENLNSHKTEWNGAILNKRLIWHQQYQPEKISANEITDWVNWEKNDIGGHGQLKDTEIIQYVLYPEKGEKDECDESGNDHL